MHVELKKYKSTPALSQETVAFTARIYVDGKSAGTARHDGHGGANYIYWDDRDLGDRVERWAATQVNERGLPMDLDALVFMLVDKLEDEKLEAAELRQRERVVAKLQARGLVAAVALFALGGTEWNVYFGVRPGQDPFLAANALTRPHARALLQKVEVLS